MSVRLPSLLRRAWRLLEARRALFDGLPERALTSLRDPALCLSARADALRERAMESLFRAAALRASQGRESSVARLLSVAAAEDPAQARVWRRRLGIASAEPRASERARAELTELVARMRERDPPSGSSGDARATRAPARPSSGTAPPTDAPRPARFHLAVDDGGELLVLCGETVTLGHARSGLADVPFLADLEPLHARLWRSESFHRGPGWSIAPIGDASVAVGDTPVDPAGSALYDGDVVRLAPNLAFRFRLPEPSSTSAVAELFHGAEAEGAVRLLFFVPGPAGRVRIGPHRARHVPVAGLEHEVVLLVDGGRLRIECEGGVRVLGAGAPSAQVCTLDCPPSERVDVAVNARPGQRPPFGLAIDPLRPAPPAVPPG